MNLADFLQPENVEAELVASSKKRALQLLSERAGKALGVSADTIFQALYNRERLGSTGVGAGVAIPHTDIPGIATPYCLLARLSNAIDFEAIDDVPVDILFLLLTPQNGMKSHLNLLSCVARQLRSPLALRSIRGSRDPAQIYAAMLVEAQ